MDPDRMMVDDMESNASALAQGAVQSKNRPPMVSQGGGEGAREAFLHMMNECQRFIDQKRKKFLQLKQGRMSITKYEREFIRLSKYARECVYSKAIMCKRFRDGLNEDIRLLVKILELKEFVILVDRACKAEELSKEKRKAESEARDTRKRLMSKSFQSQSKKFRETHSRSNVLVEYSYGNRGKRHPSKCWMNDRACFKCGSQEHFIRDCLEMVEKEKFQSMKTSNTASRGRPPRNTGNGTSSKGVTKDTAVRSEGRASARAYAIRTHEKVTSPDVITGKHVLVDRVCKNCPLMIKGHYFPAELMLLPLDEFDVVLGMNWLTVHDAIVNCRLKIIELKCENGEILRIDSNDLGKLPVIISLMSAQR
ncbi:uncharacterized protein LOC108468612 [Gossypium arboreum]|uniref:uncharacterized protein LOC108468612 n=1 Tax=Gossypium arboreum TaxID=29729 RepID=UPI000819286B|nr:uncharacterized protein LOC108468612 [Gossypium arboreum]